MVSQLEGLNNPNVLAVTYEKDKRLKLLELAWPAHYLVSVINNRDILFLRKILYICKRSHVPRSSRIITTNDSQHNM